MQVNNDTMTPLPRCAAVLLVLAALALPPVAQAQDRSPDKDRGERWKQARDRMDKRGGRFDGVKEVTAEQLDALIAELKTIDPPSARRLAFMKNRMGERETYPAPAHLIDKVQRLAELRSTDPQQYELEKQDVTLAQQTRSLAFRIRMARKAGTDDVDELTDELRSVLAEHFDVRQRLKQQHVEAFMQRIAAKREDIQSSQAQRDKEVDALLAEVMRNPTAAPSMIAEFVQRSRGGHDGQRHKRDGDRHKRPRPDDGEPRRHDRGNRPSPDHHDGEDDFEEALAIVEDFHPQLAQRIRNVDDQQRVRQLLDEHASWARRLAHAKRESPEFYKLLQNDFRNSRAIAELAKSLKEQNADEAKRKQLRQLVAAHVALRAEMRGLQVRRLEKLAERMQEELKRRRELKAEMIDQRLAMMSGESDLPPW